MPPPSSRLPTHRHSGHDYPYDALAQPTGERERLREAMLAVNTSPAVARTWATQSSNKNIEPMACSSVCCTCLGANSDPLPRLGSRPCFRNPLEGRPIPVAVSRGCARYVRRRPAFATPPALNIDVSGAFPRELKVFSKRVVTVKERYQECWAPLSEQVFGALIVYLEWRESLLTST